MLRRILGTTTRIAEIAEFDSDMKKWQTILKDYGDPLGYALTDYYQGIRGKWINVSSDLTEYDPMDPAYFFRDFKNMPMIEQTAIEYCCGKILDIGAGAGSHALELQSRGNAVKAIDISPGACSVMKLRGVRNIEVIDFYDLKETSFDTILLMMNGLGIAKRLKHLPEFLKRCRTLLNPNGQILLDSADLMHLFLEEDGSLLMNLNVDYYGEIRYQMEYQGVTSKPFDWLYVDYYTLEAVAQDCGFSTNCILQEESHAYLAQLKLES